MKPGAVRPVLFMELDEALSEARRMADLHGTPRCVISKFSQKRGRTVYRNLPLAGFGLPAGWTFEEAVEPHSERPLIEPPEKSSTNGF